MIIISGISLPFEEPPETAVEYAKKLIDAPALSARLARRAVDARHKKDIRFVYSVALEADGDETALIKGIAGARLVERDTGSLRKQVKPAEPHVRRPVVAGFGPAGMFAALYLARQDLRPIVLERGSPVEKRELQVQSFFDGGALNVESNIQFGEGGAGTFSDGKLTTRINDPLSALVLEELVSHGAPEEILIQAKPHVGTDLLRAIVRSIRGEIISLGGEVRFDTRLDGLNISAGRLRSVITPDGEIEAAELVLAPGHSARDTFEMLAKQNIVLAPKPFSVGVRIEHLQSDIDKALYGDSAGHPLLPKAEYSHSWRDENRAVYTFCMCPGGVVVAAASENGGVVTNGMSEYARGRANANSALVVSVSAKDFGGGAFDGVEFQRRLERAAFSQAGSNYRAPAQDVGSFLDGNPGFCQGKIEPSYTRGISSGNFDKIFPEEITKHMREGIRIFARRQAGFDDRNGILTGVETRTSSPVRILRGADFAAVGVSGLYPCGEGAGYAGGIVSAAVDGWRVAGAVAHRFGCGHDMPDI